MENDNKNFTWTTINENLTPKLNAKNNLFHSLVENIELYGAEMYNKIYLKKCVMNV